MKQDELRKYARLLGVHVSSPGLAKAASVLSNYISVEKRYIELANRGSLSVENAKSSIADYRRSTCEKARDLMTRRRVFISGVEGTKVVYDEKTGIGLNLLKYLENLGDVGEKITAPKLQKNIHFGVLFHRR
jgi:hypothetical protein